MDTDSSKAAEDAKKIAHLLGNSAEDLEKYGGSNIALNSEQRSIADIFGNSAEDILHYGMGVPTDRLP